jgi:hypothetical protein
MSKKLNYIDPCFLVLRNLYNSSVCVFFSLDILKTNTDTLEFHRNNWLICHWQQERQYGRLLLLSSLRPSSFVCTKTQAFSILSTSL